MTDIFREVEDDYRQELLLDFWKRHAVLLIAAIALIILSAMATAPSTRTGRRARERAADDCPVRCNDHRAG